MGLGMWGQLEMSCTFSALQLQRLVAKMSWHAAGFVTSAAERGATSERIMDHTGHQSLAMIRTYTRRTDAFRDHPGEGLL